MLGRLCTAVARHEGGLPANLPESILSAASRSLGDVSTSYSIPEPPQQASQKRHMAKKKKGSAPAAPSFQGMVLTPPSQIQHPDHLSRLQKLKMRRRTSDHMPLPLDESQRELIKQVTAASKDPEAATEADPKAPEPGLKQVGLPLSQRDIVKMVHKSLSGVAEQNVHFRPYIFTNLFQSAPAVASYVANALESGVTWPRIERFFLSSVEADSGVGAIRVQVKGRLGRKATMASTKTWEHGQLHLEHMGFPVDHGMSTAMTRVGILGIQVWVRYAGDAIANSMYRRNTGMSRPFIQLLAAKREPLPYRSSTAWWNTSGPAQPALNQTWNAFQPNYPSTSMPISDYLAANTPQIFYHDKDRKAAIAREMETKRLQCRQEQQQQQQQQSEKETRDGGVPAAGTLLDNKEEEWEEWEEVEEQGGWIGDDDHNGDEEEEQEEEEQDQQSKEVWLDPEQGVVLDGDEGGENEEELSSDEEDSGDDNQNDFEDDGEEEGAQSEDGGKEEGESGSSEEDSGDDDQEEEVDDEGGENEDEGEERGEQEVEEQQVQQQEVEQQQELNQEQLQLEQQQQQQLSQERHPGTTQDPNAK